MDASGDKQAPPFTRHRFGGSFGGPIKRNRIFFFGGYERLQEDLGQTADPPCRRLPPGRHGDPSVTPYLDLYPLPNDADLGGGVGRYVYAYNRPTRENFGPSRVDLQLSEHHALFVRHTIDKSHQLVAAGLPQFTTDSTSSNQFFTAEEKWVMAAAQHGALLPQHPRVRTAADQTPPVVLPRGRLSWARSRPGLTGLGNDSTSPSTNNVTYSTYSDDLTYTKGDHLLKVGVLVRARVHQQADGDQQPRLVQLRQPGHVPGRELHSSSACCRAPTSCASGPTPCLASMARTISR